MARNLSIFNSKKIPFGIVWMVLLFIVCEITIRIMWTPTIIGEKLFGRFDPSYNYGFSAEQQLFYRKGNHYYCYPTQYSNIHKQSMNAFKKNTVMRIFVLGGSISRGKEGNNYPYYVEKLLQQQFKNKEIEVINLSADGYGSTRMLLLSQKVMQYKPDIIIWHVHGSNEYEDERDLNYKASLHAGINKLLFSSHFFVILKKVYSFITLRNTAVQWDAEGEIEANANIENQLRWNRRIDKNLTEVRELAEKNNIKLLLIGRVERDYGDNTFVTEKVDSMNALIENHQSKGVWHINLQGFLLNSFSDDSSRKALFIDSAHLVDEGHRLFASKIAEKIKNEIMFFPNSN